MTLKVLFIAFLSCLASGNAKQNCSNVHCRLLPVGENVATEFQRKASEKGVRMVYLKLKIGNDSYRPLDVKDEFLPDRWVWARSISEPMLSLSYDYDILSLGLLNYQVRRMSIAFEDHPSGCLAGLNSSCQDLVVGGALFENVTKGSTGEISQETDTVCVAVIEESLGDFFDGNVNFFCCTKDENDLRKIRCEQPVKSSAWLKAFHYILDILTIVMILYCAAFPLALPDFIFSFEKELKKEKQHEQQEQRQQQQQQLNERDSGEGSRVDPPDRSEYDPLDQSSEQLNELNECDQSSFLYLDDASPITCSTLLGKCISDKYTRGLPNLRLSFNIKLAFLWYFVIPLFFYIKLGLNLTIKENFLDETSKKENALLAGPLFSLIFDVENPPSLVSSVVVLVGIPFVLILFLGPKDFLLRGGDSVIYRCCFCKENTRSVGKNMLNHIKKWKVSVYKLSSSLVKFHSYVITESIKCCTGSCEKQVRPPYKRLKRGFIAFLVLVCNTVIFVCLGLILGAVLVFIFLVLTLVLSVGYSPLVTLYYFTLRKMVDLKFIMILRFFELLVNCSEHFPFVNYICFLVALVVMGTLGYSIFFFFSIFPYFFLLTFACLVASLSCRFIVRMFGFLIMGLVLNAEIASPFVTFFIVAATNLFLCYYNLQKRYKEVKKMISKHWQKYHSGARNSNIYDWQDVIPEDLFWYICGEESKSVYKVLPIRREIFRMLRNMAIILIFLFLALCSVIFFGNTYNISAVASTIAVFVSGVIPGLFFKGLTKQKKFSGEKKREMVNKTEKAVIEYLEKIWVSPHSYEIVLDEFVIV